MLTLDLSFYNWELFTNYILKGLLFSVQLTVVATIGGIVFGTVLALMRLSGKTTLVYPATFYINTMRSIPLVMVILWFFLLIPMLIGRPIGADLSATITFIAFEAAFFAEIVRAGIQSVPKGQAYAAEALGMTYSQNMRFIVLPQAFRNMIPVFMTQTIVLFQDTSLVMRLVHMIYSRALRLQVKIMDAPLKLISWQHLRISLFVSRSLRWCVRFMKKSPLFVNH